MNCKPRLAHVATLIALVILSAALTMPGVHAAKRFRFVKSTIPSDGAVNVGDRVTITIYIKNEWEEPATLKVTDPNPDESALKIDPSSITGGATHITDGDNERVEWIGELLDGQDKTITFEMEALSGGAGKVVTNRAFLVDVNNPQTVPDDRDRADITINMPLEAPVLEPIENDDQDGEYTLRWSTVTAASAYYLEEADNASFSNPTPVYDGSGTEHTVTGQEPGRWYYRVRATDAPLVSAWSNTESTEVTASLEASVLEPIENDDEDGEYTLRWSTVTAASAYYLEEADNASFNDPTPVYSGSGTQHAVTGKEPGRWYYRVRATDDPLVSNWSNTESTDVVVSTPLLAEIDNPFNEPDFLVDWSDVVGATSYTLQEDKGPEFSDPVTREDIGESQYRITNQGDGDWYYRVRAEGPTGPSDWSESQPTKVGGPVARIAHLPMMLWKWPPLPEMPTLRPIENADGDGDYEVRWSSAAGAQTYVLQEAKVQTFQPVEESYDTTATTYDIRNRGASRLFYRVKARNATGDGPWSNVEQVDVVWHLEGTGAEPEVMERQTNGSVASGLTYFGVLQSDQDKSDYFYVDLPTQRTIELWLQNIPDGHNWDLALRDRGLATYEGWYSVRSGSRDEHVEVTVPAGKYYIQVYNYSARGSTQPYHLKVVY